MIIITGGAGFIGSNFVAALEEITSEPLIVCDAFGEGEKWQNLKHRLLHDIIHPDHLDNFLEKYQKDINGIIHMGAISSTTEKDVDLIVHNNFRRSKDLFDWCTKNQVRFIYASSAATYGDGQHGFYDGDDPDHLKRLIPLNAYAWSKHAFDRYVSIQRHTKEPMPPQCVGLKFFNVYGPNEYHKGNQLSVVWKLFQEMQSAAPVVKLFKSYHADYPDGGQCRDFVYVKDCSRVLQWLWQQPDVSGLFNVGTGQARSFHDLAKSVFKALNKKTKIEFIDMPGTLRDHYQYFTQANLESLRAKGYKGGFTSLEEGVKDYIQGYLMQPDPYLS